VTMSSYYPVFLDLTARRCLVVGGGPVAEGKVEGLLAAGARVTVVSPTVTERLAGWAAEGRLTHRARAYRAHDLGGHQVAFVATDDAAIPCLRTGCVMAWPIRPRTHVDTGRAARRRIFRNLTRARGTCNVVYPSGKPLPVPSKQREAAPPVTVQGLKGQAAWR